MSQRECWINVYPTGEDGSYLGRYFGTSSYAATIGRRAGAIYRLHIRLKPEGAPRRYASEHDRRNWETYPEEMRKCPF